MNPIQIPIIGMECVESTTPFGALSQFYKAFNFHDLDLMLQTWSRDECVLNNPIGGIRRGWVEIEPFL